MGSNSFFRQLLIVMFSNPKPKSRNVKQKICIKRLYIFHYKSWDILKLSITPSIHLRCTSVALFHKMPKFIVRSLFIAVYSCRTVALHSKKNSDGRPFEFFLAEELQLCKLSSVLSKFHQ